VNTTQDSARTAANAPLQTVWLKYIIIFILLVVRYNWNLLKDWKHCYKNIFKNTLKIKSYLILGLFMTPFNIFDKLFLIQL
jgi:hypothetical protein